MAKARTAAQRAATAKMIAANAKRAKGKGAKRAKGKGAKGKGAKGKRSKGLAHSSVGTMGLLPFTPRNTQANLKRLALGISAVAHHASETRAHVKSLEDALVSKGVLGSRFSYSR